MNSVPHSIPARNPATATPTPATPAPAAALAQARDFYAPRSALESAAASITTDRDTYYADCMCFSGPNTKTSKHSIVIRRASDRAIAPATNTLIVKSTGYSSVTNVGSWDTYKEAVQALLERGVQWFESKERVA